MNPSPSKALGKGRLGGVAVGYLGFSWLVLQIVDVLSGLFTLPRWVALAAILVLLVGLVMVVATALVQAAPETAEREEAGEVPTDWQIAPRDALSALASGRLPHLTWGRTLLGGVVALSLLFGAAGSYVVATEGWPSSDRGTRAATLEGGYRIAVLPFTTSGEGLGVYEEGMVELLSTNLDGLGGIRAIDSRTVLARWDDVSIAGSRPDLATSLEAAHATGASHALLGGVVAVGGSLRLTGQLYDLANGERVAEVRVEGSSEGTLLLVDRLSVAVAREILGSEEDLDETGIRVASLTTASIPALELYLEAEALYRRGDFGAALPLLDGAVRADPSFGLAVMRRAQAMGWMTRTVPGDSIDAARRAIRTVLDQLAPRDAILAEAGIIDFADRDASGVQMLRAFVRRYPDEAEGWFQLSDFLFHLNDIRGGSRDEILGGFDRAVQLAPRFAPYYIHAVESALMRADSARVRELLERRAALGGLEQGRRQRWQVLQTLLFGTDGQSLDDIAETSPRLLRGAIATIVWNSNRPQRLADAAQKYLSSSDRLAARLLLRAGRWSSLRSRASRDGEAGALRELAAAWIGAFDMPQEATSLLTGAPPSDGESSWWTPLDEARASVDSMLAARDDGTGADPILLAHLAERAGDMALAATLFEEESWREFGPAATYRLARLREREGREPEAIRLYRDFLEAWSGADPELPPVVAAREALARLDG